MTLEALKSRFLEHYSEEDADKLANIVYTCYLESRKMTLEEICEVASLGYKQTFNNLLEVKEL